ncbi:MAG: hypothetical protein QOJ69_538, partial [Actinomycetota bacterium]|nr:hypothetical protein [Actinomycetota bacterium]
VTLDGPVWLQLTRGQVDRLGLAPGSEIHLRPIPGAPVHPAAASAAAASAAPGAPATVVHPVTA